MQVKPMVELDRARPIRVLFIGNSLTYWNEGLDVHLCAMAASADPPIVVEATSSTASGAMLWSLWGRNAAVEAIRAGGWDVVILQNTGASKPDQFQDAVADFAQEIVGAGGQPALIAHWDDVNDPQSTTTAETASLLGIPVIPTGLAWEQAMAERPYLALHDPAIEWHASVSGTYLNTAVIYATLFGRSPEGLPYRPVDLLPDPARVAPGYKRDVERMHEQWHISDEDAAFLQRVAWDTVRKQSQAQ